MTLKEIKEGLASINKVLAADPNEMIGENTTRNTLADLYARKGNKLISLQPWAGTLEAEAKALYATAMKDAMNTMRDWLEDKGMTVTMIKLIAEGSCTEQLKAMHEAERVGRNISHALDFLRSCISKEKEEMRIASFNAGVLD